MGDRESQLCDTGYFFVDIVEIGAGGESIARIDHNGSLKFGPQSAGSNPGPACYGGGGAEPTVPRSLAPCS